MGRLIVELMFSIFFGLVGEALFVIVGKSTKKKKNIRKDILWF